MKFDPEDISIHAKGVAAIGEVTEDSGSAMALLARLIQLAIPTIVGATSLTVMQFIDGWLVSLLDRQGIDGGVNLAASFNGGLTAFVPLALCFGVAGLVNTFMAQSVGKRQVELGVQYTWQAIWMSILSIPVFAVLAFYIGDIFQLFGHTGELLRLETLFSRYMLATAPINFAGLAIGSFFLGLHRPGIQVIAGITGNVVNLALDYTLIFGHFGCPALHLLGAAIATLVASVASLLILMAYFYRWQRQMGFRIKDVSRVRLPILLKLLRVGVPAGAQLSGDIFCWTIFTLAWVDHFGAAAAEAQSAVMRYVTISFMPAVGLGNAVTALVANRIGAGDMASAIKTARWGICLAVIYMGGCGLVFWLARAALAGVFLSGAVALHMAETILIFSAVFQVFDAMNVIFVCSLRGAGDTIIPSLITLGFAMTICVAGGGVVTMLAPQYGVSGPWMMATIYICFSGVANFIWWVTGRWKRIDLLGKRPTEVLDIIPTEA
ncbi:MAG: MATE family efflux transporter [Phycisphaerae bacterium]